MSQRTRFFLWFLVLSFLAMPTYAVDQCYTAPSGIVSGWPFQSNAQDSVGTNNGTLSSLGAPNFVAGEVGNGLQTAGGYVRIPKSTTLEPSNALTVSAWVKASNPGAFKYIIAKAFSSSLGRAAYALGMSGNGTSLRFYISCQSCGSGQTQSSVETTDTGFSVALSDGNFHHIAGVYDGYAGSLKIYRDGGVPKGQATTTASPISYTPPSGSLDDGGDLFVGAFDSTGAGLGLAFFNWPGVVDELEIYNQALTQCQIQDIFNAKTAGRCTGGAVAGASSCGGSGGSSGSGGTSGTSGSNGTGGSGGSSGSSGSAGSGGSAGVGGSSGSSGTPVAVCGNRILETGEECEDGNTISGDGCSSTCQKELVPVCGNRLLEVGEECEDGNNVSGDGCSSTCQKEVSGEIAGNPNGISGAAGSGETTGATSPIVGGQGSCSLTPLLSQ